MEKKRTGAAKVVKTGAVVSGSDAYYNRYGSWSLAGGLPEKIGAFVEGSANFLTTLGLASGFAVALMGVFVASFAAFTACSIHVSRALNLSLQTFESWFADHKAQIQIESRLL